MLARTLLLVALAAATPRIAIVIDDIGYRHKDDNRVLGLPTAIAVAVIPDSPNGAAMAARAADQAREVLLHLPMQALNPRTNRALLEPLALRASDSEPEIHAVLARALAAVPQAVGVSNHMGSQMTQQPESMRSLMRGLAARPGLYFLDSYTTAASVALQAARQAQVPATRRDVFLDHDPRPEAVALAIERLLRLAERDGSAVAIGHPLPDTLTQLEALLPRLEARGIELVAPSALLEPPAVTADASTN
ncbi:MAG: divergent polysaccharide deacetylase family protein [Pseudomonadota bacterium]